MDILPLYFPRVGGTQPAIWNLNLISVPYDLSKDAILVAKAVAPGGIVKSGKGVQETSSQPAESSVAESWIHFLLVDFLNNVAKLGDCLFIILLKRDVNECILKSASHEKLEREVGDSFQLRVLVENHICVIKTLYEPVSYTMSDCLVTMDLLEVETGPGKCTLNVSHDATFDCLQVVGLVLAHNLPNFSVLSRLETGSGGSEVRPDVLAQIGGAASYDGELSGAGAISSFEGRFHIFILLINSQNFIIMGAELQTQSIYSPSHWETLISRSSFRLLRHTRTSQIIQQHTVFLPSPEDLVDFKLKTAERMAIRSSRLVQVLHVGSQKTGLCINGSTITVMTQRIRRLGEMQQIPHKESIHFLLQALQGFKQLQSNFGSWDFELSAESIGYDQNNNVKVWHSPNFGQIFKKTEGGKNPEDTLIYRLLLQIQKHHIGKKYPHQFLHVFSTLLNSRPLLYSLSQTLISQYLATRQSLSRLPGAQGDFPTFQKIAFKEIKEQLPYFSENAKREEQKMHKLPLINCIANNNEHQHSIRYYGFQRPYTPPPTAFPFSLKTLETHTIRNPPTLNYNVKSIISKQLFIRKQPQNFKAKPMPLVSLRSLSSTKQTQNRYIQKGESFFRPKPLIQRKVSLSKQANLLQSNCTASSRVSSQSSNSIINNIIKCPRDVLKIEEIKPLQKESFVQEIPKLIFNCPSQQKMRPTLPKPTKMQTKVEAERQTLVPISTKIPAQVERSRREKNQNQQQFIKFCESMDDLQSRVKTSPCPCPCPAVTQRLVLTKRKIDDQDEDNLFVLSVKKPIEFQMDQKQGLQLSFIQQGLSELSLGESLSEIVERTERNPLRNFQPQSL